ncbi:MAG: PQQ-dependent sugar dehydrogenase [Nitriliruptoraceae bacterium]
MRPGHRRRAVAAALAVVAAAVGCGPAEAPPAADLPVAPAPAPASPSDTADPGPAGPHADGAAGPVAGADVPVPTLALELVARLDAPIDAVVTPDGTLLVAERAGRVLVVDPSADGPAAGTVVVDVSERTTTDGERGLLALTVSPDGRELVLSLTDEDGDTRVEAHPLDGARVIGPPRVLYALAQPYANHNGGDVAFAPDGTLLVALGDGGGGGDPLGAGQDPATPLGSLLRLDVGGGGVRVPADNPFVGVDGAAPEILAVGLRNPWRFHVDLPTRAVWIADVGQGDVEEVNRVPWDELRGANLGWPLREGDAPYEGDPPPGHVAPVHTYRHGPGCSVTGGVVARDPALPALAGAYLFSDFCDGTVRALRPAADGTWVAVDLGVAGDRVVGFATDASGRILVLDLDGRVLRLVPA